MTSTLLGLVVLLAITGAVLALYRVRNVAGPLIAVARAAAQLACVSLILAGVISSPLWVGVALAVMFVAAAVTAGRRIERGWRHVPLIGAAMLAGVLVSLVIVFGTGALALVPRYALAVGGMIIGNAMTIAALAGRRFRESVREHWDEVEGWLALGATGRQATADLCRRAVQAALIPSIDQTKTTGLVTLPGAFVGAIFAGASPLEAGRFQIVVLAAILTAGAITAVGVASVLAPVSVRPDSTA